MAFLDEGHSRWTEYVQSGSGNTAIDSDTEDWLLVKGSQATTDKYRAAQLTNAATDVIDGVTQGADDFKSIDPYKPEEHNLVRVKTAEKLRVRTATAYVATDYGKGIAPDATSGNEGFATVAATAGTGRIVGGETIGTKHYLDFWMNESSPR